MSGWSLPKMMNRSAAPAGRSPGLRRYIIGLTAMIFIYHFVPWNDLASPILRRISCGGLSTSKASTQPSGLVQLKTLDPELLPGRDSRNGNRRLIVVGDVHGCYDECTDVRDLLHKVSFNRDKGDHLIFTGDMIAKGPKSMDVVRLARRYNASCVRGNHEDRILRARRRLAEHAAQSSASTVTDPPDLQPKSIESARELSDEDAEWLETCPVILKIGMIEGLGEVVVVHGGLVPGVDLENQDPSAVMNMRTLDRDTRVPSPSASGTHWAEGFNEHQSLLQAASKDQAAASPQPTTVIYGHDARRSLCLKEFTKGLDTGCVRGGKLTAFIIESGGKTSLEQVSCPGYHKQKN